MSRARELLRTTPQCVLSVILLCTLTFAWQTLYQPDIFNYTMRPRAILYKHQIYRLFTSPFLHGSISHIAMNMMSYTTLGTQLERSFGTMWHYTTILWSACFVNSIYVFLAFVMFECGMKDTMNGNSLGFSGILFHLLVVQCSINASSTQSVFGLFQVNAKVYPWVLLILIQLILPNVSFVGHLSGIIVGEIHTLGYLNYVIPSPQRLRGLDDWNISVIRRISSSENYVKTPFSDEIFDTIFARSNSNTTSSSSLSLPFCSNVKKFVRGVLDKIKVKIFGRGRELNENIRLNETEMNSLLLGVGDVDDIGEEDNWVGLHHQHKDYKSENV